MKIVLSFFVGLFSLGVLAQAQNCCANLTTINTNQTLLNTYYPPAINQIVTTGSTTIQLDAVPPTDIYGNSYGDTPIQAGDLLLIVQMQGASFNTSNSNLFGSGTSNSGPDGLGATGYTNLQSTGNYEYVVALNDVPLTGGSLQINGNCSGGLVNTYANTLATSDNVIQTFQVIRVPRFQNLTLNNDITTTAWNGRVGGVISFEVVGELDLNGYSINASGRGFRGGYQNVRPSGLNNNVVTTTNNNLSSGKGEGISGTPRFMWNGINPVDYGVNWIGYPGGDYGRGAPANAGGGGNVHNAGGGGGGNGGMGGVGGNGHAGSYNLAAFPNGGRMGSNILPSLNTLIMGGGGGGGDANNATTGVKGGPGGGVILLQVGSLKGIGSILSNGFNGEAGVFFGAPDGAGGGGAGGSILIITNAPSPNANVTIEAKGGNGGNTLNDINDSHGPGGGGGGGVLMHNITDATLNTQLQGGQNGLTGNGLGVAHGASAGQQGIQITVDSAVSGDLIADLFPNPIAFFEASNVCVGQSFQPLNLSSVVSIQNSTLVSYLWDFGDGTTSNEVNPTHIFASEGTYTVSLQVTTNWGCTDTFNVLIEVLAPTIPNFNQISPVNSGETFTLPSTSLNGINGSWVPEVNNLQTTTYTFIPDEPACVVEVSMTVQVLNTCDSSGWTSSFRYLNPPDQIVPFNQAIHPEEGLMYLEPSLATSSYYWSKFEYVPEEPICVPNNFYFEFKINSNSPLGIPAYDTLIDINATGGTSWVILMGESWGQPWTQLGVNDNLLLSNSSVLIFPSILDWSTIKMEYNNGFLNYYVNNQLFFSGPYEGDVCNINSFSISFKGSGSVDYVKVANLNNQIIYLEEFDDCENMSAFPDLCNIQPVIVLSSNTPDCNTPTLELSVDVDLDVQNLSFLWTGPNGFTSNEQNPILPNIDNSYNGLYTCAVQTNSCNSVEVQSIEITNININPIIEPEFLLDTQICFGANLSELPTISNNGITGTWSPALNNTATTTYTFTPDAGQCATTASMTITVNPNITPAFTQVSAICSGATLASLPTTSNNGITGTWSPALNNTATTTYSFTPDDGQCATTALMTITVNQLPAPPTGNSQQNFCAIDNPTIGDLVINGNFIHWYLTPSGGVPLNINYALSDELSLYAASYNDITNCENPTRLQITIQVENPVLPSIEPRQEFCLENILTLGDINTNGISMIWYDSPVGGNPILPTYILENGDTFYGAATNNVSGCESTTRIPLDISIINSSLEFNNLITVDDNDLNKELIIAGIEQFPNNAIEIYNRYGNLVWSGINYNNVSNTFKGMANFSGVVSKGSYLPTGTYFFILSYPNDCEKTELKGFIHIDNKL